MPAKKAKKTSSKVSGKLGAKSMKQVKGGINPQPLPPKAPPK